MLKRASHSLAPYALTACALISALALSGCSDTTYDNAKIAAEDAFASISNLENDSAGQPDGLITPQNTPALALLLQTQNPGADQISDFLSAYQGRAIEFDACVVYVSDGTQAPGERTLNDIELVAGETADGASGPVFRLNGVNVSKTGLSDVEAGQKVDLIATVGSYDSETDDIMLGLVSITERE